DCEGLSFLQENHRLRTAGLRRGTQLRSRSINHLIMVSGWWGKGAPSTIKSVYPQKDGGAFGDITNMRCIFLAKLGRQRN
ncbi:MAG: hypothetical protein ACJARF_002787, partial [Alteromonadaceae bacterium]